jgi:hypothetical protein
MSVQSSCLLKAKQCEHLAATATDPRSRVNYEREARLWRGFADDVVNKDGNEAVSFGGVVERQSGRH